ncbi:argininosuccinate lyase [candidate division KSB1 bacterium]|nr:argininosuccinate lyase [candidate division KSB1 bacterium]
MKLWQKKAVLDRDVEAFTVGDDYLLDYELLPFDCQASKAHVRMLTKIGILSDQEGDRLLKGLDDILSLHQKGVFEIKAEDEDCHTAIENYLVRETGTIGEKVHTGRSRNDQVLTAIRLYSKSKLTECEADVFAAIKALDSFIAKYGHTVMPGYSHMRKAMPMTVAMWGGAFRDAFSDDQLLLYTAMKLIDQNPLGTGAGFGISLPLDRQMTTRELGFSKILHNPVYAQNSRGKFEGFVLTVLSNIMGDLNRLAADLLFFTLPELGYFSLPDEFHTGSSIMPHKKNPDVLEILRGKYHEMLSLENRVRTTTINLISGYQRDLQLTKAALVRGFTVTLQSLRMTIHIINHLHVNAVNCKKALTKELFSTDKVHRLVQQGTPFRQAYRKIGDEYEQDG